MEIVSSQNYFVWSKKNIKPIIQENRTVSDFKEKFDIEHLYIAKGLILLLIYTV